MLLEIKSDGWKSGAEVYGYLMGAQTVFIGLADLVGGESGAFDDAKFVNITIPC